ncbi:hypothetical protein ACS0TY_014507 [Phlomoides rotata]
MVCAIGRGKMTALERLLDAGSVLQTATEEAGHQRLAVQYAGRELQNADEANLLDEEDMHIFGSRPMTDPLDLVRCNACKRPIKASQYAAHAELCKTLCSRDKINLVLDGPAVNRKPPRKERKKLPITQTRNMHLSSTHTMNGSRVNPHIVGCSKGVTKCSSKPLKRIAVESPPNPGTKNLCKTTSEVIPYVPAPLATKIYYSQRNQSLRRAICHMFFEESNKESNSEAPDLEAFQVNATPAHTSSPGNIFHDQVANQQRDDRFLHLVQTPDQILPARSDFYVGNSGAFVPCVDAASRLPVNNTLGPHYVSNSYPFTDKSGSSLSNLQQGGGSVPVV